MLPLLLATLFALLLAGLLVRFRRRRARLPLPPGPKKLPLVGNLFGIPSTFQWETYMQWSKIYKSDIIHLDVAGSPIIVLSSMEAVNDLLEKRSSIYSDRPSAAIMMELTGWDFLIGAMRYGEYWRSHRRLSHQGFEGTTAEPFHPCEREATRELLRRFLDTPDGFMEHLHQMAGEIIMSTIYGIEVLRSDDPYITLGRKAMHEFSVTAVPGKFLVDSIPLLKHVPAWFPGAGFKRYAEGCRILTRAMLETPFAEAKRRIAEGTAAHSFVAYGLSYVKEGESLAEQVHREKIVKGTAASMYAGGAGTTVSAIATFMLGMLANPKAQRAAQREIDAVVGSGRLPDFTDEEALPYVAAIVMETLRWKNVAPFAVPHFLAVEDQYRGYRIPANSIILPNVWAILHDEAMYPDPYSFKPERFLLDGKLNPAVRSPEVAFGFGRRICPGKHLAASSIRIAVASILATFDISKAMEEDGRIIEPTYDYIPGLICMPVPFRCSIKPRSQQAIELIQGALVNNHQL
ncbi:cytochrome P450 [Mycena metata]|uniref:Cytochrome P450 n=1 Tax=Mycena metata TaxID=1033252 RepID=A0AAD7I3F5_9AGAR|nr:cytochrome P450 [Mycena metata]